jgi:hypothetical protein
LPGPRCHRVSYCVGRNRRVSTLLSPPGPSSSSPGPLVSSSDFLPKFFPCTSPVPGFALPSPRNLPCLAVGDLTAGEGIRHQTRPHQPEVFSRREARSPPSPSPPPTGAALAWTGDWRSIRARINSLAGTFGRMGVYLSTPKTEKLSEDGENDKLKFGLSSMQGWRATMEDSHSALLDLDNDTAFFGVFDGHGGNLDAKNSAFSVSMIDYTSYQNGLLTPL